MAPSLTQPQGSLSPADALQLAQQAPTILRNNPKTVSASPLSLLFSAPETADLWTIYENLLLSCLRTGDDEAAYDCLDRLIRRFGADNERIMAFEGLLKEATAETDGKLQVVLKEYEEILKDNAANIVSWFPSECLKARTDWLQPIAKRRVALLRSLGKTTEAITALTTLLDYTPTDAEGWAELAELYLAQGLYSQAIYAMEEVLVLVPNAWNVRHLPAVCLY